MQSAALFIGIGALALVALSFRFSPRCGGTGNWRDILAFPKEAQKTTQHVKGVLSARTNPYRELSLTGRTAVGLLCFERYCHAKGLRHPLVDAFLRQMWEVPCMKSLPDWESHPCELVAFALGGHFPDELLPPLQSAGINNNDFRRAVENCVEIFYCSAYGASDNAGSLTALNEVLAVTSSADVTPPPIEPFLISVFADAHGWGKPLSSEQRDAWRLI